MPKRFMPLLRMSWLLLPAAIASLGGCSGPVLDPAGDIALQQRDIIFFSTALMLLIIVPVIILIVLFAWRYRKGGGAAYDPSFDHSAALELAIWSAPLLIIIALGALTWSSTHLLDPFRPLSMNETRTAEGAATRVPPLVVQVVSLDWKWLFIYPEQGIATVNELVLPIDREVRFDITSSNMMNTFYAPTLAGMIYAMPGMQSQMHAVLRRTGDFEGYSANYSGAGFSDMRFRLRGVDDAGFADWLAGVQANTASLSLPTYRELVKPSEKVPVIRYASVDPELYRLILERCVDPNKMCIGDMMRHAGHGHALPGGASRAQKSKGAILREGAGQGEGAHITGPASHDDAAGVTRPGAPRNRNQS